MNRKSFIFGQIFAVVLCAVGVFAQAAKEPAEKRNFGFTKNPPAKVTKKTTKKVEASDSKATPNESKNDKVDIKKASSNEAAEKPAKKFESIAQKIREITKEESRNSLKPTEIYKVGVGDVLFIGLQESRSNYFTILKEGSIDYPLAGGLVAVADLTVEEIEQLLGEKIQLFENPEVTVKVREYASHEIDVIGLVGREGKQYLQREAMPLYVVRAQALAKTDADIVIIKRKGTDEISIKLGTPEFDEMLIYPGDIVEFASTSRMSSADGYVYIGGSVIETGRFGYHSGMTLTQAIMAAGGVSDSKIKKAVVRRKDDKGFLKSTTYKINDIRKGKAVDPDLQPGDMIEVGS